MNNFFPKLTYLMVEKTMAGKGFLPNPQKNNRHLKIRKIVL